MHVVGCAFAAGVAMSASAGGLAAAPWMWLAALALVLAMSARVRSTAVVILAAALLCGGLSQALSARDTVAVARSAVGAAGDRRPDTVIGTVVRTQPRRGPDRTFTVHAEAPLRGLVGVRVFPGKLARGPTVWPGDRVALTGAVKFRRGLRVEGAPRPRGPPLAMATGGDHAVVLATATGAPVRRWAARRRHALSARIAAVGGDAAGNAVVRAMVSGDRSAIEPAVIDAVRAAGIAHVLSVSGLHLACVAVLVFVAVRRSAAAIPMARRIDPGTLGAMIASPVAIAYTLITGAEPPTVRALVVVLVMLVGIAIHRRGRALDAIGVAAIGILAVNPGALWDPSFQLSFAAAGILALTSHPRPRPRSFAQRAWSWISGLVRTSLWAQLATAPITAAAFGQITTGSVLGNIVAIPACELAVLPLGLAGSVLAVVWPAAGHLLLAVAIAIAGVMMRVAAHIARLTPLLAIPPPTTLELFAAGILIAGAVAASRGTVRRWLALTVCALSAAVILASYGWTMGVAPGRRTALRISFIDVGQGDAAVLELPGGAVWLIDAGGRPFVAAPGLSVSERRRRRAGPARAIVAYLRGRRITHLDRVILSHPHPDHFAGLWAVADAVSITEVWVTRADLAAPPPLEYRALLAMLAVRGTRIVTPHLGLAATDHQVRAWVLAPGDPGASVTGPETPLAAADPVLSANDNSMVVRIDFGGRRILFAGDIEREGEARLVARVGAGALAADVVKVAHHGSRTSSTPAFARATSPAWAIISCGIANRFRFPHPATLAAWRHVGAHIARIDLAGTVTLTVAADGAIRVTAFDPRGLAATRHIDSHLRRLRAHGM